MVPLICCPLDSLEPVIDMVKTMWDLEDCSLAAVAPAISQMSAVRVSNMM